jgi:sulfide:quinone oxidoreductase
VKLRRLTDDVSVAGQIDPEDIPDLAAMGFRSIVCNRPDGEDLDQPGFEEVARAATRAGLNVQYVPVVPGHVSEAAIADFGVALRELPKPLLAYCRSGTRSASLWALVTGRGDAFPG